MRCFNAIALSLLSYFIITLPASAEPIGASPESGVSPCPVCNCGPTTTVPPGVTTTTIRVTTTIVQVTTTSPTTPSTTLASSCPYYKLAINAGVTVHEVSSWYLPPDYNNWDSKINLDCYKDEMKKAKEFGVLVNAILPGYYSGVGPAYFDDAQTLLLLGQFDPSFYNYLGAYSALLIASTPKFTRPGNCNLMQNVEGVMTCTQADIYFDDQCNPVNENVAKAACGTNPTNFAGSAVLNNLVGTPISLMWKADVDIDADMSMVNFPLELNSVGKSWLWKASSDTPLLVYDPEHKGEIKDATQLFGRWTFGGQKVAALLESSAVKSAQPWENGYAALKTMDQNYDQKVSDKELDSLALWFDENRDGVSQAGEVKRLDAVGVKELYFNPDKVDPVSKNIHASIGFAREVNGKIVKGESIDWFADGAINTVELYAKHILAKAQGSVVKTTAPEAIKEKQVEVHGARPEQPKPASEYMPDRSLRTDKVTGVYAWKFDDKNINSLKKKDGYLVMFEKKDGEIVGITLSELPVGGAQKTVNTIVKQFRLDGKRSLGGSDESRISFNVNVAEGSVMKNIANVSADGKEIVGETIATVKDESGKPASLRYRWKATKIEWPKN
ncbi:MAG: hypothetical protein KBC84_01765 [Proteobacteria bacterium]|nr:hypothetical protein [Pseudomonadota bacterium]